jgi:hypothetical protein
MILPQERTSLETLLNGKGMTHAINDRMDVIGTLKLFVDRLDESFLEQDSWQSAQRDTDYGQRHCVGGLGETTHLFVSLAPSSEP